MIADLQALRHAPVVAPYAGPAILSGRASGVLFHEIFGHRIEGHRQKREEEGQTFKRKIGERVLPETFSVFFDPTTKSIAGRDLVGAYKHDNQGVKARRVAVVENGIFRRFLMSRSPIENFPISNGHGRKQPGYAPVARQSNLIVETSEPLSRDRLKEMLIDQCRNEGKEFGLYFEDIQGGFTITGRFFPNAFNVFPIMVYRIYTDGREELVRGVDLIGTPLTAFSRIAAADDRIGVFNGNCGAESGWVPVAVLCLPAFTSLRSKYRRNRSPRNAAPSSTRPPPNRMKRKRKATSYSDLPQKYLTILQPIHPVSLRCLRSQTLAGRLRSGALRAGRLDGRIQVTYFRDRTLEPIPPCRRNPMHRKILFHVVTAASILTASAIHAENTILQRALRDELARSMKELQLEDLERPYFISYHVHEMKSPEVARQRSAVC